MSAGAEAYRVLLRYSQPAFMTSPIVGARERDAPRVTSTAHADSVLTRIDGSTFHIAGDFIGSSSRHKGARHFIKRAGRKKRTRAESGDDSLG